MSQNITPPGACERCGTLKGADAPEGLCPKCLLELSLGTQTEVRTEAGGSGEPVPKQQPLPPLEEIRRHFPQFELIECLGRGGMGVVYKARQPRLNRYVAIKILAREREKDPRFAERFTREAQALARMNHPNIVTVYDFGETTGLYYLLMEFVDGMSLRQLLQTRKLTPAQALEIVPHICEALQYAHEQGIVHRDIKPENLLLDKQGRVKIADFGIAKLLREPPRPPEFGAAADEEIGRSGSSALTQDHVVGTPHYMAPEQVEKPAEVDHRADIYSLGVVFYEMLTGELPLGKFPPPSSRVRIDVRLDEVVLHALEKEPGRRYQHASEVKSDVENISRTELSSGSQLPPVIPPSPRHQTGPGQLSKASRGAEWKVAGIIAVCLLLLLAIPILLLAFFRVQTASKQTASSRISRVQSPQALRLIISGSVTDYETGLPISGARVSDDGSGTADHPVRQAWTDLEGYYQLSTWDKGQKLLFSASGYQAQIVALSNHFTFTKSGTGKTTELSARLRPAQPHPEPLKGVTVNSPVPSTSGESAEHQLLRASVLRGKQAWAQGDYPAAFGLLLPAALKGDPVAQHRVGVMYTLGQGVAQDTAEATQWFRKAAEQGQAESQYSLALRYTFGQSVTVDLREAHRWYLKAAEQGIGAAAAALARQFMRGEGVDPNPVEAYKWALIGSTLPDPSSADALRRSFKERLSADEVAEAQRRAATFKPERIAPADP